MDINFFEQVRKKKKSNLIGILILGVISIILALTILLYVLKKVEYTGLENELNDMNATMDDPNFQEKLNSVSVKENELTEISESYKYLETLSQISQGYHTVREDVIKALAGELTKSLYFDTINIVESTLKLDGHATNIVDIAQFEYNLNHCGLFENVIVNTVEEEEATYFFSGLEIIKVVYNYKFDVQLTILNTDLSSEVVEDGDAAATEAPPVEESVAESPDGNVAGE